MTRMKVTLRPQRLSISSRGEDYDHTHKQPGLLGHAWHNPAAQNADGTAGCQATQAHIQASACLEETLVEAGIIMV